MKNKREYSEVNQGVSSNSKPLNPKQSFYKIFTLIFILLILGALLFYFFHEEFGYNLNFGSNTYSTQACFYNGMEYPDGAKFSDDYNSCKCTKGKIICERFKEEGSFTTLSQEGFENRYKVSLELSSYPSLRIDTTPFGERGRENQMTVNIVDDSIGEELDMGYASIDIKVVPAEGRSLQSFVKEPKIAYRLTPAETDCPVTKITFEQITKWRTNVYKYSDEYTEASGELTSYILKSGDDFILIDVYINNNVEEYNKILDPILDSLEF